MPRKEFIEHLTSKWAVDLMNTLLHTKDRDVARQRGGELLEIVSDAVPDTYIRDVSIDGLSQVHVEVLCYDLEHVAYFHDVSDWLSKFSAGQLQIEFAFYVFETSVGGESEGEDAKE